jgi:hypothetical protein
MKPTKKTNVHCRLQTPIHKLPASFTLTEYFGRRLCLIFAEEEMGGPNNMGQPRPIANYHKKEKKP